jgi:DNA polymerase-3 subunit alpha/DNA polymerase-3 subunit epsilon
MRVYTTAMTVVMLLDSETSGLFPRNADPRDLEQFEKARVVSIAWRIVTMPENVLEAAYYSIIDIGGEDGPVGAEFIHGITRQKMQQFGVSIKEALNLFMREIKLVDKIVAHNVDFDMSVILSELYRMDYPADKIEQLESIPKVCTMKSSVQLCQLPWSYPGYKWPKQSELYSFLFNTDMMYAHSSFYDVEALHKMYIELVNRDVLE